jgi:anti-sigma factor RsiW
MKDPDRQDLIARALRGPLSQPEEREFQALLRSDPAFHAEWQLERALDHALAALPDAPVSTNFTSLVLQAALHQESPQARPARPWFRSLVAKLAAGLATLAVLALALVQQREGAQRRELAATVNAFTDVASVVGIDQASSTDVFENFEAIQLLSLPAESELDLELLVALQR